MHISRLKSAVFLLFFVCCDSGLRVGTGIGSIQWLVCSLAHGCEARGTSDLLLLIFCFRGGTCPDDDASFRSALGWSALSLLPYWSAGRSIFQLDLNGRMGYNRNYRVRPYCAGVKGRCYEAGIVSMPVHIDRYFYNRFT